MKLKNDLVLRAARRERTERTPVWLMRQAGRTDPAYRALREQFGLTLEQMFRDPEAATAASLLPRRLGVDAIIFFQDILTPLSPMGADFVFRPGPVLTEPIRTASDVGRLSLFDPTEKLGFIGKTLRAVKDTLAGDLPLLGFAGAPLTLAFFLIEGKSPGATPERASAFMREDPKGFHGLLDKLADMTADYLLYQIESGADAVQLFESCADVISAAEYETFAHPYHTKIFDKLGNRAPKILFAKERAELELMAASGANVVSIGRCIDFAEAKRRIGDRVALQGNVDNRLLVDGSFDDIDQAVRSCIEAGDHRGHILNLNHGLLQETPFDNVCRLVETARTTIVDVDSESTVGG